MTTRRKTAVALTIAGSDSGGGAGIQADLKTFRAFEVFGTAAVTCITAQNPERVSHIQAVRPQVVVAQMERVIEAFPVSAAKTGMLFNAAIIEAVAATLARHRLRSLVVDPVMVATSGAMLLQKKAVAVLCRELLPQAAVMTPNLAEAEVLTGHRIDSRPALREAAWSLADRFEVPVLVKGGHLPVAGRVWDVLYDGRELYEFSAAHVPRANPHGAGCTFSAAIAAGLARGDTLQRAVQRAKRFIARAIRHQLRLGRQRALGI